MSKIILNDVKDFNAEHIFECGQCFRWNKQADGSYTGVVGDKVINVSVSGKDVQLSNTTVEDFENIFREYFDLDRDYGMIKKEITGYDSVMEEAIKVGEGIRILKQDLWETIASFIISANNNIPRIKNSVETIASNFGHKIDKVDGVTYYSFPDYKVVANLSVDDLAACGLGYRSKYLVETANILKTGGMDTLKAYMAEGADSEVVYNYLIKLPGVGPKVANCIMLFGMGITSAFPIDTWVKKVMHELYGFEEENTSGMEFFAIENFGQYAGIAQQYLFYYMRKLGKKSKAKNSDFDERRDINRKPFDRVSRRRDERAGKKTGFERDFDEERKALAKEEKMPWKPLPKKDR